MPLNMILILILLFIIIFNLKAIFVAFGTLYIKKRYVNLIIFLLLATYLFANKFTLINKVDDFYLTEVLYI